MDITILPVINAFLNGTSAVLLVLGKRSIKAGNRTRHKRLMISAFCVSSLFLVSYLTYHSFHGVTTFMGPDWARILYLVILGSHTIIAVAVVPMAIMSLRRGLKDRVALHKRIAKWTQPLWLYVSVTGVVVYLMLYQLFPAH